MEEKNYNIMHEIELSHWWYRVRRLLAKQLLQKYAFDAKKILDIGCGTGALIKELQAEDKEIYGVDMSETALNFCKKQGVKNLFQAQATNLPFEDKSFSAILLLDVLEHIENEDKVMTEIKRVLKPGGVVIIFAPCFKFLWSNQDEISQHYRRYTMSQLKELTKGKFNILKNSYFNFFLFPLILVVRLIINLFKIKLIPEGKMNNNFLNKFFYFIFLQEIWFINFMSFPFGVSAFLVLKNKG